MIDTVAIKHYIERPPSESHLRSLGWLPRYHRLGGTVCAYVSTEPKGSMGPRLTISLTPTMAWQLTAEASLPKLLRGVNVPLLDESEIESSLRLLATIVEERSGLTFDTDSALVSRVDFARDFNVSESDIVQTVAKFFQVQIPRYDRTQYNDTTVVFMPKGESRSKRISVYGKLAEVTRRCDNEEEQNSARDLLRVEVCLRTKALAYITRQKPLDAPNRETRHILTRRVASFVMDDALQKLQFEAVRTTEGDVIAKLLAHFGLSRTKTLLGFLELRRKYGEGLCSHEEINYGRRTYFRDLADCRRAGVLPS